MQAGFTAVLGLWALGCLAPPASGDPLTLKDAAILAKLEEPIPLDFKDAPLGDVLKQVKQSSRGPNDSGIPIFVDPDALTRAGVNITTPVSVQSRNGEPLKSALDRLLESQGLRFVVADGLLKIVDRPRSILRAQIIDREAQDRAIRAALEKPLALSFQKAPLEDVLKFIKSSTKGDGLPNGLPIYIDPVGLQEAGKTMTSPVTVESGKAPLKDSLRTLLKALGLAYQVRDGLLTITSIEANDVPVAPGPGPG
jgi:hypothetical protein